MNCPTCGSENAPDSRFCEDCGAQLSASSEGHVAVATEEGPLSPGLVLQDRWRIDQVLEEGRINRYLATDGEAPALVLESSDVDGLRGQHELVKSLESPAVWVGAPFEHEGRFYLAGPRPGPERLEDRLQGESMSAEAVTRLGRECLEGLAALHQHGLLHLALQPARIWMDGSQAVLDPYERLCRAQSPDESYTVTPGYSSPEAYGMQGGLVDPRSDLFSLGAVMHYALSRQRPDLESRESFFSFPRLGGGPLADVIMKAVSKSPAERWATAREMLGALEALEAAEPAEASSPSSPAVVGRYEVALKTDIGCVRSINQDACLELEFQVWEKDTPTRAHLVVVADGMGGEAEGDKAASLAIRSMAREVLSSILHFQIFGETNRLLPTEPIERARLLLQRSLEVANRSIYDYSEQDHSRRGMGCTITCAMLLGDTAVLGHVGDTRGYRFRGSELDLVTSDHSLVGRLVQMGQMSREEARHSPQRSIIYRALGTNAEVEVDLYERRLAVGDYLLLCSDGVWEYYADEELSERFGRGDTPAELAEWLVATCLERGADDNATCAVIRRL